VSGPAGGETGPPDRRTTQTMEDARPSNPQADLDIFGRPPPPGRDWSHRRGEPRIFAFFWTLYLLLATVGAFWRVGAPGGHDVLAMRPAARSLLAAVTVGVVLLWPMTRLSQRAPGQSPVRVARAVWQDMLVILVPAQAIIWPQVAMAGWPLPVVAALAASIAAWTLVVGALVAFGLCAGRVGRAWWMLAVVALAGLGPLAALGPLGQAWAAEGSFAWWWMTSPLTSGFEITRDRAWTGASAAVEAGHWRAIAAAGWAGVVGWALFALAGLFRAPERD
jgi:hypothetical protein